MNTIDAIEAEQLKEETGEFRIGDTVKVHFKIVEGANERIQIYEGVVIARRHSGIRKTFTVRKISNGVGVERVFQTYSPAVASIEVKRRGDVRRAKLYYLRGLTGKAARIKEKVGSKA